MEDAIRLVNENYLQVNSHFIRLNEIGFYVEENYIALQSPTVYSRQHSKIKDGISHQDEQDYVKKEEDGTYTEYSRNLSFNPV
ncbi:MAG: hypothetical protein MJ233_05265 [Mycoplasmoidaceae bacterium]|nr:hypothetical protein [Mycoplasmoidaceae bacterium]